jgi:hypothetical protein
VLVMGAGDVCDEGDEDAVDSGKELHWPVMGILLARKLSLRYPAERRQGLSLSGAWHRPDAPGLPTLSAEINGEVAPTFSQISTIFSESVQRITRPIL